MTKMDRKSIPKTDQRVKFSTIQGRLPLKMEYITSSVLRVRETRIMISRNIFYEKKKTFVFMPRYEAMKQETRKRKLKAKLQMGISASTD